MLEQNHDYNKLLKEFETHYVIVTNFYLNKNKVYSDGNIKVPRKRFTEKRKQEIREHHFLVENYAETAKAFSLNESTVRIIVKSTIRDDVKLSDKGNSPGAGRPLTYPKEVESELVAWILELLDLHLPVAVLALQEKAKKVIRPHNPIFAASRVWVEKFFTRYRLLLRNRTSVRQKLPQQLEEVLTKFYEDAGRFMGIGKYPRSLVGNMDETPEFFDMVPVKSICKTGSKECIVRTSGCEK